MERVSNERRAGDVNTAYKLRGEMMKLIGNSSYGKCITNFLKHETVKIVSEENYQKNIEEIIILDIKTLMEAMNFVSRKPPSNRVCQFK